MPSSLLSARDLAQATPLTLHALLPLLTWLSAPMPLHFPLEHYLSLKTVLWTPDHLWSCSDLLSYHSHIFFITSVLGVM